jgi:CobQ-like glutamine amidotransferase family enzyme
VCAGLQILGQHFAVEGNNAYDGLGLVDAVSVRGVTRSVGDIATQVGDHVMVGFENHGGVTNLGDGVTAFGDVLVGRGNDGQVDGYVVDRIMATYAHGPVLAMNPWLADRLLSALFDTTLSPLATSADKLHQERLRVLGVLTNQ